jgi:hypothetical protein
MNKCQSIYMANGLSFLVLDICSHENIKLETIQVMKFIYTTTKTKDGVASIIQEEGCPTDTVQ